MARDRGLSLTPAGMRCCNPSCGRELYVELMAEHDAEACFECDPEQFREGWMPALADLVGRPSPPHHCSEDCCRLPPDSLFL